MKQHNAYVVEGVDRSAIKYCNLLYNNDRRLEHVSSLRPLLWIPHRVHLDRIILYALYYRMCNEIEIERDKGAASPFFVCTAQRGALTKDPKKTYGAIFAIGPCMGTLDIDDYAQLLSRMVLKQPAGLYRSNRCSSCSDQAAIIPFYNEISLQWPNSRTSLRTKAAQICGGIAVVVGSVGVRRHSRPETAVLREVVGLHIIEYSIYTNRFFQNDQRQPRNPLFHQYDQETTPVLQSPFAELADIIAGCALCCAHSPLSIA